MKKVLFIMAAVLMFTQCRKSEDSAPSEGKTVNMTVMVGPGSKTDITATGGITWSEADKLYVGYDSKYVGYITLADGVGSATGRFSGKVELTGVGEGDELTFHFYYLGSADHTSLEKGATSVDVDFSSQNIYKNGNGKLENASQQHVCYGSAKGTVKDGTVTGINVELVSKVAIACFDFKNNDEDYTGVFILRGDNIYNKMTVNFNSTGFDCEGTKGNISLTNTTTSKKYVMLVPTSSTTGSQTLTFGGDATGETTLANGIRPNKFYGLDEAIAVTVTPIETVNFGTPNLNWSKYNLGVNPEHLDAAADWYGGYYAWGETAPYYQNGAWCEHPSHNSNINFDASVGYKWKNYLDGSSESWKESLDWKPYGSGTTLTSDYDAATAAWGGDWRMPTSEEWQALYNNNTFEWLAAGASSEKVTSFTAVAAGYLVIKGKDSSLDPTVYLFLPAAGFRDGTSLNNVGSIGRYWSSSLNTANSNNAYRINFYSSDVNPDACNNRYFGFSVRPVR